MVGKEELEILIRETFEEYQSATEVLEKLRALEGTLRKAKKTQSKTSAFSGSSDISMVTLAPWGS